MRVSSMNVSARKRRNTAEYQPVVDVDVASMKVSSKNRRNLNRRIDEHTANATSMKALPKRKGNPPPRTPSLPCSQSLNERPSGKEEKMLCAQKTVKSVTSLNESPSKKERKSA